MFENLTARSATDHGVVTSIRVEPRVGAHDRITLWNRGGNAGTLHVIAGDGMIIANLLTNDDNMWRLTSEAPEHESGQ